MEKYLGVKIIEAEPENITGFVTDPDFTVLKPVTKDGYKIVYEDGYTSWCPKDIFEKAYRKIDNLTFGQAIEAMKKGKKVTRTGWNGKGMFLWLDPEMEVKAKWCNDPIKSLAEMNGGTILALGTICMYTHDASGRKAILTGWLASQSDMLSEDWAIINED